MRRRMREHDSPIPVTRRPPRWVGWTNRRGLRPSQGRHEIAVTSVPARGFGCANGHAAARSWCACSLRRLSQCFCHDVGFACRQALADSRCPCHSPRERVNCRQRPSVQINRRAAPSEFRQPVTDARYPGVGDITHIFTQMLMSTPHIGRILAGVEVAPTDAQDMLPSSPSVRDRLQSNASHAYPFGNS
jgi:hypothetical protein